MPDTPPPPPAASPSEIPDPVRGDYRTTVFYDGESAERNAVHLQVQVNGLKNSEYGGLLAARIQENLRVLGKTALAPSAESGNRPRLTVKAIRKMVRVELAHLPILSK